MSTLEFTGLLVAFFIRAVAWLNVRDAWDDAFDPDAPFSDGSGVGRSSTRDPLPGDHGTPSAARTAGVDVSAAIRDSDVCTVLLPDFVNMDVGPRCGKPAVKRLPILDFPVCAEHAEMFSPGGSRPSPHGQRPYPETTDVEAHDSERHDRLDPDDPVVLGCVWCQS